MNRGVLYGLAAYVWWGAVPLYFKAVAHVPPPEVLAHRVVWSFLLLAVWLGFAGRMTAARRALADRRTLATLVGSALLVSMNWLIFIWAVSTARVVEASLGYFINPLVNVLLGMVFLGERLRRAQWVSLALAMTGVAVLTAWLGSLPWIALVLAFSFGFYGLLRKTADVDGPVGLMVETGLLVPAALAFLLLRAGREQLVFGNSDPATDLLLVAAGAVTALPLVWFVAGARRLPLSTMGFLQYVAPTGQFLLGVLAFGELFTTAHALGFGTIWTALAIYSWDLARHRGRHHAAVALPLARPPLNEPARPAPGRPDGKTRGS
ncbi:MAG: EamA family transporter RarD [Candidatus Krumholzibacteriia bacterium]